MIVLDANILIRAILGRRVRQLLDEYSGHGVRFYAPDVAYADAGKYLPSLLKKKGKADADLSMSLRYLRHLVEPIGWESYGAFEGEARLRLRGRDEDDWPVVATALALAYPIWTEDTDFFGVGVAVWTTNRNLPQATNEVYANGGCLNPLAANSVRDLAQARGWISRERIAESLSLIRENNKLNYESITSSRTAGPPCASSHKEPSTMRRALCLWLLGCATLMAQLPAPSALPSKPFSIRKTWVIGGHGPWDYLTLDPKTLQLYIAHAPTVQVMDVGKGAVTAEVKGSR
jgi:predicted nucleic acid-binding protein